MNSLVFYADLILSLIIFLNLSFLKTYIQSLFTFHIIHKQYYIFCGKKLEHNYILKEDSISMTFWDYI